eukprot:TRINITY_DN8468_c0_g1_i1.p1 TRINITY_DN8468_c0_g1~~TRINITY_DN8468_c0_g1_i1.p1  ORF type:complete len:616 (+),score=76.67 TRINITY_DN8468_c0_g1_i1:175-2022(+)
MNVCDISAGLNNISVVSSMGFALMNFTAYTSSGDSCSNPTNAVDLCGTGVLSCKADFNTKMVDSIQLDPSSYSNIIYVVSSFSGNPGEELKECPDGLFKRGHCPTPPPTLPPSTPSPSAVPTSVPILTAVPTSVPIMPTSNPEFRVPIPLSDVPTVVPTTVPVSTSVPTGVPTSHPTLVPVEVVTNAPPSPDQKVYEDQATVSSAITSVASASGALPTAGAVISSSQPCDIADKDKLPFPLHPTRMEISGSVAAGAVIGNGLLVGVFALIFRLLLLLFKLKLIPKSIVPNRLFDGFEDTQGMLRFPSVPLFLYQVLHQGTFLAALLLIRSPPDELKAIWISVGVLTLLVCVGVPVIVFRATRKAVPMDSIYYDDYNERSPIKEYWIGRGEWISVERNNHWVNRYASVVRPYRQKFVYFSAVQFSASGLVAIAVSMRATGATCALVKFLTAGVFLLVAIMCMVMMPFARMCDNHLMAVAYLIHSISLVCIAVYYLGERVQLLDISNVLHYIVLSILLLKVGLSLVVEVYVFITKRRVHLQENHWIKKMSELEPIEPTQFHDLGDTSAYSVPIVAQKLSFKTTPIRGSPRESECASPLLMSRHVSLGDFSADSQLAI